MNNRGKADRKTLQLYNYTHVKPQNRKFWGFVGDRQFLTRTAPRQRHHSPHVSELRINGGEPHEELVLQPQRSLSEDGGRPVVQSRRPANVKPTVKCRAAIQSESSVTAISLLVSINCIKNSALQ